jgi:hypothetical protein
MRAQKQQNTKSAKRFLKQSSLLGQETKQHSYLCLSTIRQQHQQRICILKHTVGVGR